MPALSQETDGEYGRGLALVEALADEWSWQPCDGGKLVYARLKLAQDALTQVTKPCVFA